MSANCSAGNPNLELLCLYPWCVNRVNRNTALRTDYCPRFCRLPYCCKEHFEQDVHHHKICRSLSRDIGEKIELVDLGGENKGIGMVARRAFRPGEEIFRERALAGLYHTSSAELERLRKGDPQQHEDFLRVLGGRSSSTSSSSSSSANERTQWTVPPVDENHPAIVPLLIDWVLDVLLDNSPERFFKVMQRFPLHTMGDRHSRQRRQAQREESRRRLQPWLAASQSYCRQRNAPISPSIWSCPAIAAKGLKKAQKREEKKALKKKHKKKQQKRKGQSAKSKQHSQNNNRKKGTREDGGAGARSETSPVSPGDEGGEEIENEEMVKIVGPPVTTSNLHLHDNLSAMVVLFRLMGEKDDGLPPQLRDFFSEYIRDVDVTNYHQKHAARVTNDFYEFMVRRNMMPAHFELPLCQSDPCASCQVLLRRLRHQNDEFSCRLAELDFELECPTYLFVPMALYRVLACLMLQMYFGASVFHVVTPFSRNEISLALFPMASTVNHRCGSNSEWSIVTYQDQMELTLVATGEIAEGEEINISYIEETDMKLAMRQEELMELRRFKCRCPDCQRDAEKPLWHTDCAADAVFAETPFFRAPGLWLMKLIPTLEEAKEYFFRLQRVVITHNLYLSSVEDRWPTDQMVESKMREHNAMMDRRLEQAEARFAHHDVKLRWSTARHHARFLRAVQRLWEEVFMLVVGHAGWHQWHHHEPQIAHPMHPRWMKLVPLFVEALLKTAVTSPTKSLLRKPRLLISDPLQPARLAILRWLISRSELHLKQVRDALVVASPSNVPWTAILEVESPFSVPLQMLRDAAVKAGLSS